MTCFLDWRTEPEIDVAEEIEIVAELPNLRYKRYTVTCRHGNCFWAERVYSPGAAVAEKNAHAAWHEEGCPE